MENFPGVQSRIIGKGRLPACHLLYGMQDALDYGADRCIGMARSEHGNGSSAR